MEVSGLAERGGWVLSLVRMRLKAVTAVDGYSGPKAKRWVLAKVPGW